MVILDGLGDRPHPLLAGATPLEAARTPVLDQLVAGGSCGLTDPFEPGVPVDTPTGTGVLFGVPEDQIRGLARGPVEAAGVGLALSAGDVAVRCNFATVQRAEDGFVLIDRRAGRIRDGTGALAAALTDLDLGEDVTATVRAASQHRAVLRLAGPGLSAAVTNTDPGGGDGIRPLSRCAPVVANDANAARTARALNRMFEIAYARLNDHPVNLDRMARGLPLANGLITRGAGLVTALRSTLTERGLGVGVVAGERTIVGLARLLRFRLETDPSFTAMPDTDLDGKVRSALSLLETQDVVYLHVKAPDICAHDRDPELKRQVLERVDNALAAVPLERLVLGVCGDHCTDCTTGDHCGDPVPALLHGPGIARDEASAFDEATCAGGGLGRLPASEYLRRFLAALTVG